MQPIVDTSSETFIAARRSFLTSISAGLGLAAVASLLHDDPLSAGNTEPASPFSPRTPHLAPKARHCIFINLFGGPSQADLFDPKPLLSERHGQPLPESFTKNVRFAFLQKETATLLGSPRKFAKYGESGLEFSDLLPHLSTRADDLCVIRSMHTDTFAHTPGEIQLSTGVSVLGRPSLGSWMTYGLGSPSQDLPGFVVLTAGGRPPEAASANWGSGFLPPSHQGVPFRSQGEAILNLNNPAGITREMQRLQLSAVRDLNQRRYAHLGDPEISARIAAYESAYRMQTAAPELIDLSGETHQTLEAYGVDRIETEQQLQAAKRAGGAGTMKAFSTNCLLARRLVERGVRFVNLYHGSWDHHDQLDPQLKYGCEIIDQPIAALIGDLKQRGLLDSTLVVWASEFGRTPLGENRKEFDKPTGRDHHPFAFTVWMAGGGVKGGHVVGKTDEFGWGIVEQPVHINDFHATLLHLFGLDHMQLTYRFQGRDFRLTDVGGRVIESALA
ncbi:MAG: DUF1501 domain-containing protein [Planctomycetaceae bacterium]